MILRLGRYHLILRTSALDKEAFYILENLRGSPYLTLTQIAHLSSFSTKDILRAAVDLRVLGNLLLAFGNYATISDNFTG